MLGGRARDRGTGLFPPSPSVHRQSKCFRSRDTKKKKRHQHCLGQDGWYGLGKVILGALVMAEGWLKEV